MNRYAVTAGLTCILTQGPASGTVPILPWFDKTWRPGEIEPQP